MKVVDVLKAARAKIERPENWIKNISSTTADGKTVKPWSDGARCFCIYGAIQSVLGTTSISESILIPLRDAAEHPLLANWNDSGWRTHAEVLAAFDRAIAAEEAKT